MKKININFDFLNTIQDFAIKHPKTVLLMMFFVIGFLLGLVIGISVGIRV